jgi:hypothetical protein
MLLAVERNAVRPVCLFSLWKNSGRKCMPGPLDAVILEGAVGWTFVSGRGDPSSTGR